MNRRHFLRDLIQQGLPGLVAAGSLLPGALRGSPRPTRQDALRIPATLQPRAFAEAEGDDALYHALVHEGGGAAAKALLTTPTRDSEIARVLRAFGAEDGGGVPMSAWNLRRLPFLSAPRRRVRGSPIRLDVEWEGWALPRPLESLLLDPGGRGVAFRFGGNEEHDHLWDSGCVACLFSCPGGVISNERYAIRDRIRGVTRFLPVPDLPPDGTGVSVLISLETGPSVSR